MKNQTKENFYYQIDAEQEIIVEIITGDVTFDQIIGFIEQVQNDEKYQTHFNGICDITGVKGKFSESMISHYQQLEKNMASKSTGKWAILVNDPKLMALAMLHETDSASQIKVFSTWEAACKLLDIEIERPFPTLS